MLSTLHRVMQVNKNRGSMSEVIGITLLYEIGDIGYGVSDWICKGFLRESHCNFMRNHDAWLSGGNLSILPDEGELSEL